MIGMALGYLVYHWQKQGVDFKKYQKFKYRLLYWSQFPLGVLCCYSGSIFYYDAPRQSVYIRMVYAAFSKPAFSLLVAGVIVVAIFRIEESQYALMPPLMKMDPYEACQLDPDALYCTAEFVLVSDEPSPLLDMIKEFSEHKVTHYNHTKLLYGLCATQTCKKFYRKENQDLKSTLEACLNESLSEKYELKAKIFGDYFCNTPGESAKDIDRLDIIVGAICFIFLVATIVGSLCGYFFEKNENDGALRFLLCFSLQRNWTKLVAPAAVSEYPRIRRLKSFHGLRVLVIASVIICHSWITALTLIENPEFIEKSFITLPYSIVMNGTLIMQTSLMMSSFLLVYNWMLYTEEHQVSWNSLPMLIVYRWLRLTPAYAVTIALTATWMGHLGTGPLWNKLVAEEMNDCRQYWWQNILYINNYYDNSQCVQQSWYIATDIQLHYLGLVILFACRTTRSRNIILSLLFLVGMVAPAAHVFFRDLDGTQLGSPETTLSLFLSDPHFNMVYKRAYTNLSGFVVGMVMGLLVYHWQVQEVDVKKYQKLPYRVMYWSLLLLCLLCVYSGSIFYLDAPRLSVCIRMAYAAFTKSVFSILNAGLIIGFIFKFEGFYRGIMEWRGWTTLSRVSYNAYLLHVTFIKNHVGSETQTRRQGFISVAEVCSSILAFSFIAAFFLWLLVEAPVNNLVKECFYKPPTVVKIDVEKTAASNNDHWIKKEDN